MARTALVRVFSLKWDHSCRYFVFTRIKRPVLMKSARLLKGRRGPTRAGIALYKEKRDRKKKGKECTLGRSHARERARYVPVIITNYTHVYARALVIMTTESSSIDERIFRLSLRSFSSRVTKITTRDGAEMNVKFSRVRQLFFVGNYFGTLKNFRTF